MFFQRMLHLLSLCQAINITMSQEGEQICLVINPTANANSPAGLRVHQVLRGTAQELDEGIAEFLASMTLGVKSIQDQIAENEAKVQEQKSRLKDEAKSKSKATPNSKQVVAESSDKVEGDGEEEKDDDESIVSSTTQSSEKQITTPSSGNANESLIPDNLFGED